MSDRYCNKRKYAKDHSDNHPVKRLSDIEYMTVERHIITVYVLTIICLLGLYIVMIKED